MDKKKIKQYLEKSSFGRSMLIFNRACHDPQFLQWYLDHNIFRIQEFGSLNSGKVLFVINNLQKGSGFFFSWCQACRGLMVADRLGFIPVIDWSNGAYFDESGMNGCMNPFEYFFEPVSSISLDEAMQSRGVTFFNHHTDGGPFSLYEYHDEALVERFVYINNKYLHIRPELYSQIHAEISSLLGSKKTLAVHVRGVEWGNVHGHPIPVSMETYISRINSAMKLYGYEQIFLASDSEDTIEYFKHEYGDLVVCYDNVTRSQKGSKVLVILDADIKRENNGFHLGCEVLKDMLTLSFCDGIVAGLSCVSFAADVFKRGRGENYLSKDFIEQQVCKKGISVIKLGDRFKENP